MFDIGWTELLVIGVVALIVIGPKDLPEMFRQLGRFTAKLRSMARDFQRAMEQAAKDSGAGDVAKDLKTLTSARTLGVDAVREAADRFEKWDPLKPAAKPAAPTTASAAAPVAASEPASATPAAAMGPATRALAEKQAQRKAILRETAERLKAVNDGVAPPAAEKEPAARPRGTRRKKAEQA